MRFIIRKEYFGGLIYDRQSEVFYVLPAESWKLLDSIKKLSYRQALKKYRDKLTGQELLAFNKLLSGLKDLGVLVNNELKADFIINDKIKAGILSAPRLVYLSVTNKCPLRCRYCYSSSSQPYKNELSLPEIKGIIDRLKAWGVFSISIEGGDIFSRPDIFEIMRYIRESGFSLRLTTNGYLLDKQKVKLLKELQVRFPIVSLDGPKDIHEYYRGKGSFDRAINSLNLFKKEGFPASIEMVISPQVVKNIDRVCKFLKEIDVGRVVLTGMKPSGRSINNYKDLFAMTPDQINTAKLKIGAVVPKKRFEIAEEENFANSSKANNSSLTGEISLRKLLKGNKCSAAVANLSIEPNGEVFPCVFLREALAEIIGPPDNIRDRDIADIWLEGKYFRYMRNLKAKGKCSSCEYYLESCSCGCPARSYFFTGDLSSPDPFCPLVTDKDTKISDLDKTT